MTPEQTVIYEQYKDQWQDLHPKEDGGTDGQCIVFLGGWLWWYTPGPSLEERVARLEQELLAMRMEPMPPPGSPERTPAHDAELGRRFPAAIDAHNERVRQGEPLLAEMQPVALVGTAAQDEAYARNMTRIEREGARRWLVQFGDRVDGYKTFRTASAAEQEQMITKAAAEGRF